MNHVSIFGRFTRDPELKYTPQGKAVVSFSLAVNRYDGNEADFFDCEAWEKQAENIANSCRKGHRLLVWGRLRQDRWTDQQTQQNRSAVRIVVQGFSFIEPPPQQQGQPAAPPAYGPPPGYTQQMPPGYVPPAQAPAQIQVRPAAQPPAPGFNQYQGHPPYPGQTPPAPPPAGPWQQPANLPPGLPGWQSQSADNYDDLPF